MPHIRLQALLFGLALIPASVAGAHTDDSTVKDGWSVNPVPALAYDSDFGLMAGGFLDINYYGGLYPAYRHRLCLEALTYSKHASFFMLHYDSRYLIPGIRTSVKLFYEDNPLYWFYGFNGAVHDYDSRLNCNRKDGIAYYSYDRKYFNGRLELEAPMTEHLDWTIKLSYWHYWIKELNWDGYDPDNTLLRRYKQLGLIEKAESNGGDIMEVQAGLKYDTRNIESMPSRGIYADVNLAYAPDITYHMQQVLQRTDLDTKDDADVWFLTVHSETVANATGNAQQEAEYQQMMYAMYYNNLYGGGYGGYGGYGYGSYGYGGYGGYGGYSNYYNMMMMASMLSSMNQTTYSTTQELDKDRYYRAVLNGPAVTVENTPDCLILAPGARRVPTFRVTFSVPKG